MRENTASNRSIYLEVKSYFTLICHPFRLTLHGRVHGELGFPNPPPLPLPPLQMPRPTIRLGNASALLPPCVQSKGFPLPYQNARMLRCSGSFACCRMDERSVPTPHVSQSPGMDNAVAKPYSGSVLPQIYCLSSPIPTADLSATAADSKKFIPRKSLLRSANLPPNFSTMRKQTSIPLITCTTRP